MIVYRYVEIVLQILLQILLQRFVGRLLHDMFENCCTILLMQNVADMLQILLHDDGADSLLL